MKKTIEVLKNNVKIRKGLKILFKLYKIYAFCKGVIKVTKLLIKLIEFIF